MSLSVLDAFKWRHSVRTYLNLPIPPTLKDVLANAVDKANSFPAPFSTAALVRQGPPGLGILGIVKGELGFLLPLIPSTTSAHLRDAATIDAAARAQVAVLELSRARVGTVWLGGIKRSRANQANPGFSAVAGIAYGLGEDPKDRGLAWLAKLLCQPRRRKPIAELFYDIEKKAPFTEETAGDLLPFFTAVRSSPSGGNLQPWRFAIDGKDVHVYTKLRRTVDAGIALGSIEVLAIDSGHAPRFSSSKTAPATVLGGRYVASCSFRD
jgi:nitroreductase